MRWHLHKCSIGSARDSRRSDRLIAGQMIRTVLRYLIIWVEARVGPIISTGRLRHLPMILV